MRYHISRRDPPVPVWTGVPAPSFTQGIASSISLSALVVEPSAQAVAFTSIGTSLPAGVTIDNALGLLQYNGTGGVATATGCRLRATSINGSADSALFGVTIVSAGTAVDLATFSITSATGGAQPFAFGHAFRQGDVPAGTFIGSTLANFQASPLTFWPDGSVKHAIIAGRAATSANVATSLVIRRVTTAPTGTALTTAQLAAAMPTVTITGGAHTTTLNSLLATPHRTVVAGPQMSNWIYRQAVSGSTHLVVWADVRYYANGEIEIFPWVENAYLTVAGPTNDVRTWGVTINGVSRFSQSIDIKHHTRVPLVTGSTFSYWVGTDPQVTPAHDMAYLKATKLVPNYGYGTPSAGTLNGLQQTYTANTLAGISSAMNAGGTSAAIINNSQAFYVTSNGDARAYRAALVFGLSGGSWSIHYRDNTTNEVPKFSSYPDISLQGGTPSLPAPAGGENGTAVTTHQPSYGYLPFLITGRWWFWEESAFWTVYNYMATTAGSRRGWVAFNTGPYLYANGGAGVIDPSAGTYANRGAAWSLNKLAQTLTLCPDTHPAYVDFRTAWESNMNFYRQKFVSGTHAPGWVSPMGIMGEYSADGNTQLAPNGSAAWWGSQWMSNFTPQVLGFASEIGLPQSAQSLSDLTDARNQSYKHIVERASASNWRRFTVFKFPMGTDGVGLPPDTWFTTDQAYAEYTLRWSLPAISMAEGGSLKVHQGDSGTPGDPDITATSSAGTDYLPFAASALAYAVDHGYTGASAGWGRITGASNWPAVSAGWADNPGHGVAPRTPVGLPSWVPSPGTFANLGTSTLQSVRPSGWPTSDAGGPFANWAGGVFARDFGNRGGYVVHGSGHLTGGTPIWAGVWVFDLDTLQWVGRNVPAQPLLEDNNYNGFFESTNAATLGHTYAPHTYDGLIYQPASLGGGPSGSLIRNFHAGANITNPRCVHRFDLSSATSPATRVVNNVALGGGGVSSYPGAALDEGRGGYWVLPFNGNAPLAFVRFSDWSVTYYNSVGLNVNDYVTLTYIPAPYDCLVSLSGGGPSEPDTGYGAYVCRFSGDTPLGFSRITTTGTRVPDRRAGGCWSTLLNCIVAYGAAGSSTVHKLTPPAPANVSTGTWTWTSETLTGVGGATPSANTANNGALSRFIEVPALRCFIWADSINQPTQAWRLTGM